MNIFGKILLNYKLKKDKKKIEEIKEFVNVLDVMLNDINTTTLSDVQEWLDEAYKILEK